MQDPPVPSCIIPPIRLRINIAVLLCLVRAKSVLHLTENRLEYVEIVLYDFPLILGQVE